MKVLIVGSTGMVGSEILKNCISNKSINKIYILNRRKSEITHKKVTQLIQSDFTDFSKFKFPKVDTCFYCIGVYQRAVPKYQFIEVTYNYLKSFLKVVPPSVKFSLLSAQGANPESFILFAKWKGKAEQLVKAKKFNKYYMFRPGYIHPTDRDEKKKLFAYQLLSRVFPVINLLFPGHCVELKKLAKTIVDITLNGSNNTVFENKKIRED